MDKKALEAAAATYLRAAAAAVRPSAGRRRAAGDAIRAARAGPGGGRGPAGVQAVRLRDGPG